MKKKIIILISIILLSLVGFFILLTGSKRSDVCLKDFSISSDNKTMTLNVFVTSSSGYIRKMKRTSGSMNYYFTFYSTFGINSKLGAKDTFIIDLDKNVNEIYFYSGDGGYKKVLKKNDLGEWMIVKNIDSKIKNITTEIFDISPTGATVIITDRNKESYAYGEWYKIEKEENNEWIELEPKIKNYGFNEIGYLKDKNNKIKFVINWEWLYGKLSYGSYRIVKEVNKQYIYVPFSIATTS